MCGITGIFDTRGGRPISEAVLRRMNDAQHHRGPDEGSVHVEPGVGFGHRRLSIIDVATGQQPLFNEDGSVVVVFNGEIYNYQSLIPELQALGHVFHTKSDTECIVHAWEQWGEDCVQRFRGMFAFTLWDRNRQTLFMARDRLGVKPMHYAVLDDGLLLFGSELKSLMEHGGLKRDIDPLAVEEYFSLGYVAEPRTIFRQALKLPPGHMLSIRRGQPIPQPKRYWDVNFTLDARIGLQDACDELNRRLQESVKLRMIAEVPLGAFLSGGVDSSAVVATMAGLSGRPGQHLLDLVCRSQVQRERICRHGGPALPHQPPRGAGGCRRLRPDRHPGAAVRRALCRQLGHPHLPGVPAGPQARHRGAVG